jgi:hypothetical protein
VMKTIRETTSMVALGSASQEREAVKAAFQEVQSSFETFLSRDNQGENRATIWMRKYRQRRAGVRA